LRMRCILIRSVVVSVCFFMTSCNLCGRVCVGSNSNMKASAVPGGGGQLATVFPSSS